MARRMFLSETAPAMVLGEQPPGPGWREARRVDVPGPAQAPARAGATRSRPASFSEPAQLSLSDMVSALSTAMAVVPLQETPGDAFHRLAELRSRAEGISLRDAYSEQAKRTPELWDDVRNAAPRGY